MLYETATYKEDKIMLFTVKCPRYKKAAPVNYQEQAQNPADSECCLCSSAPSPDIMTAYQQVGKSMVELYGCCSCENNSQCSPAKDKI